jgi:4-hydroxy-tetrahydrodipicolinate reductase
VCFNWSQAHAFTIPTVAYILDKSGSFTYDTLMRKKRYITRVGLLGFGRTGKKVAEELCRHPEVDLVCVFKKHRDESVGRDIGSYFSLKPTGRFIHLGENFAEILKQTNAEVIVDFSSPDAVSEYIDTAALNGVNFVICSTNFTEKQKETVNMYGDRIGIVWAPNVTEGINILISLGKIVKAIWPESDMEIIEYHFSNKKEISKTALKIAEAISDADSIKFGRRLNEPRIGKETVIHTIRVGGIIGRHTLIIGQPHQTLSITHESIDRYAFGKGALKAALWVKGKMGIFDMVDVLNIKGESHEHKNIPKR